ncbi:MAG: RluA family pseudouridine synthase [Alphaproteobacteria bacterium]
MKKTEFTITAEEEGSRLDRVVMRHLGKIPHAALQKMLRNKDIRLDGRRAEASSRVAAGQVVEVRGEVSGSGFHKKPESERPEAPARTPLRAWEIAEAESWVIYKDKDILALNKPPGLATQGGTGITKHVDKFLPALQFEAGTPPRLVHRIDKDTSGLLLLARSLKAARELQALFAGKHLEKTYLALTVGVPRPRVGEIVSRLEKTSEGGDREKMRSADAGKKAITHYKVREALANKFALVELVPLTGRTHQLRVHMAEMGCPILGDGKYGGAAAHVGGSAGVSGKLHLHAWKLALPGFMGRKPVTLTAELPEHFARALEIFELELEE